MKFNPRFTRRTDTRRRIAPSASVLLMLGCSQFSQAQLFSDPHVEYIWQADLVSQLLSAPGGAVLCESPWSIMLDGQTNLTLDEDFTAIDGGCDMVTLSRAVQFSASTAATQASVRASTSIGANTIEGIGLVGHASGDTSSWVVSSFQVRQWTRGNLATSYIADLLRENATTQLDCEFRGPIDPSTGVGVLHNIVWAGSSRFSSSLPNSMFPPGTYELRVQASGAFAAINRRTYAANLVASVNITSATATSPVPELDLDADGLVGLSDACLWPDAPTDANQDGQTNQADLEFILALARANGEQASDSNGDGIPDQCGCPADWNNDGQLDFFDVQAFIGAFALHDPAADLNDDGLYNFFDIQEFLSLFSSGC